MDARSFHVGSRGQKRDVVEFLVALGIDAEALPASLGSKHHLAVVPNFLDHKCLLPSFPEVKLLRSMILISSVLESQLTDIESYVLCKSFINAAHMVSPKAACCLRYGHTIMV